MGPSSLLPRPPRGLSPASDCSSGTPSISSAGPFRAAFFAFEGAAFVRPASTEGGWVRVAPLGEFGGTCRSVANVGAAISKSLAGRLLLLTLCVESAALSRTLTLGLLTLVLRVARASPVLSLTAKWPCDKPLPLGAGRTLASRSVAKARAAFSESSASSLLLLTLRVESAALSRTSSLGLSTLVLRVTRASPVLSSTVKRPPDEPPPPRAGRALASPRESGSAETGSGDSFLDSVPRPRTPPSGPRVLVLRDATLASPVLSSTGTRPSDAPPLGAGRILASPRESEAATGS
eukprot:CAMPEP_0172577292 /NCGR_PEP_ID=MMETSP1067-20121228/138159_1 /TAXON_ID=265564 ORGANISM="Thalassiosira punctigera, Strain Tpunct2005C2" /NCGR_SAMPLE_ID=MMETSP1067 /ASSEMBLY_ACC=CAM_ASM_000444 /LENGTH=291 /DNA_ID=CAMNT_0013369979 /DNA_START=287 /DNA_END=1158 /DNA_ORIENTATION=-